MKQTHRNFWFLAALTVFLAPTLEFNPAYADEMHNEREHEDKGHEESRHDEKDHDHEHHENHEGHEEPASGASFKPGKGIFVNDETGEILGLTVTSAVREKMPKFIRLNVQIFGETHRFTGTEISHSGCDVHGSGFVVAEQAPIIKPQQPLQIKTADGRAYDGFVVSTQKNLGQSETEVLVGVKTTDSELREGDFVEAVISIRREEPVVTVPRTAILRTVEGTFVYKMNDETFLKVPVRVGSETREKVEITEGLTDGDQVVSKPVETLWLIELRATKGGGHSH